MIDKARQDGFRGKVLILAPKSVMSAAWVGDGKFFPHLKIIVCWANTKQKRRELIKTPDADILVTNYDTFKALSDDFYAAGVRWLVIDESSKVKNHESQISKACHRFSDLMDRVNILSGTPAPNSRVEYWSQLRCVDKSVFGDSFYRFASRYFFPIRRLIMGKQRVIGYAPIRDMEQEFFEKLQSCTWSLTKEECLDLPEQIDITREVELSDAEFDAYQTMLSECQAALGDGRQWSPSVIAKAIKLRQITGGMMISPNGIEHYGTSKLDTLSEILEEIGPRPVVIWAEFTHEINAIVERCKQDGRSVGCIDGRVSDPAVRQKLVADLQSGLLDTLVCHPQAAGHGITLTAASYCIYYSHGFSFETHKQSRDRIHRQGQTQKCVYYHLVAAGTVDTRVVKALHSKADAHDEVMALLGGVE